MRLPVEIGVFFCLSTGEIIAACLGNEHSISLPDEVMELLTSHPHPIVMTHNHPVGFYNVVEHDDGGWTFDYKAHPDQMGSPLSPADLQVAATIKNLVEVRAVTPKGYVYSAKNVTRLQADKYEIAWEHMLHAPAFAGAHNFVKGRFALELLRYNHGLDYSVAKVHAAF